MSFIFEMHTPPIPYWLHENIIQLMCCPIYKSGHNYISPALSVILIGKRSQNERSFTSFSESTRGMEPDESSISSDLAFLDLTTIAAATNSFSAANKLGTGGFGSVYKVLHSFPQISSQIDHKIHRYASICTV